MKTIYHWQTSTSLADHLGRSWQQVTKDSCHPYEIERQENGDDQPLFRVAPPAYYRWQGAKNLGAIIGQTYNQVANQAIRYTEGQSYRFPIERKSTGGERKDRDLYRIDPASGWEPGENTLDCDRHYWLEWPGYIDVHDGAVDEVVATYFFHDVEPDDARRMADKVCERMNGEVAA